MRSGARWVVAAVFFLTIFAAAGTSAAYAHTIVLADGNATLGIDPHSSDGAFSWVIDGIDHLFQQSFWWRILPTGGESNISVLPVVDLTFFGTRGLQATYTHPSFTVEVVYLLAGGTPASGTADVAETIKIINTSASVLNFNFFQYTDFDLNGTSEGDVVERVNPNAFQQTEGSTVFSETVVTPAPGGWEAAFFPFTRTHLTNATPSLLNNVGGPIGPGDVTWAWQWGFSLDPRGTFLISKDKRIEARVPEPESALLFGCGLLGLVWVLRTRRIRSSAYVTV